MATIDVQVEDNDDDGYEKESDGSMDIDGGYVYHDSGIAAGDRKWAGHRFILSAAIPLGSTITVAYYEVKTKYTDDDANINIHFEKIAAPLAFTIAADNITGRTRTTASVSWVGDSLGSNDWLQSPSLVTPLQELVDAVSPTVIAVIIRPNSDANKKLRPASHDNGTGTEAAKLHIEYTVPVVGDDMTIIRSFDTPEINPSDITFDGRYLWVIEKTTPYIWQIDPATGTAIRGFSPPTADCRGITFDGESLFVSDNVTGIIYQINPVTGTTIRSFATGIVPCFALQFDGHTLWAIDYTGNLIYQIDIVTGTILRSFAEPSTDPRGIAFDGRSLYIADITNAGIYQVDPITGTTIRALASTLTQPTGLVYDGRTLWVLAWAGTINQIAVS